MRGINSDGSFMSCDDRRQSELTFEGFAGVCDAQTKGIDVELTDLHGIRTLAPRERSSKSLLSNQT
jgi:hypothetical protein